MPNIRISNSTFSGGTAFEMNAANFTLTDTNLWDIENEAGKANTSGLDVRLPSARYQGQEAPRVSFQGFVDTTKPDPTYTSGPWGNLPYITLSGLGQLKRIGSGYLYHPAMLQYIGSPVDRQNLNTGSISVIINNVKLVADTNFLSAFSGVIPYSMDVTLVSGPV